MVNQIDLFQTNGTLLLSRNDISVSQNTESNPKVDFPTVLDAAYHASKNADYNDLEEIFEKAAQTYNISVDLLKAVAKAESDFDPNCVSSSGAMGIMQLMPGTAKELGVTDAFDPEQNIMGGAKYLAENLKIYDGNVSLALAAYNAGRGNVSKYGGIPPFKETRNYVKKVLGFMGENVDVPDIDISSDKKSTKKVSVSETDKKSKADDAVSKTKDTKTAKIVSDIDVEKTNTVSPDTDLSSDVSENQNIDYLQEASQQLMAQSAGSYLLFNRLTGR